MGLMTVRALARAAISAIAGTRGGFGVFAKPHNVYRFECRDRNGNLKWVDEVHNAVTTAGKNDMINNYWKGSSYSASFFIALISATPTVAAGDTMASHAGWTEVVAYSDATRRTLTLGSASSGSADNSGSVAVFNINADSTAIGGGIITTNSTKSGTSGVCVGGGALSGGNKTLSNGDTLSVTVTVGF